MVAELKNVNGITLRGWQNEVESPDPPNHRLEYYRLQYEYWNGGRSTVAFERYWPVVYAKLTGAKN